MDFHHLNSYQLGLLQATFHAKVYTWELKEMAMNPYSANVNCSTIRPLKVNTCTHKQNGGGITIISIFSSIWSEGNQRVKAASH